MHQALREMLNVMAKRECGDAGGDAIVVEGEHEVDDTGGDSVVVAGEHEGDGAGGDGVVVAGKREDDDTGGDGVVVAAVKAASSKQDITPKPHYKDSNSKNKRRTCPYRNFFGVHLKRHLQAMHGDKVASKQEQMRLVYRADTKDKKTRGQTVTITNKYKHIYQCGIPGCQRIVSRMSQHLKRFHKISDPGKLAAAQNKIHMPFGPKT